MGTGYNYKKKYEFQLSYADQLSSATFTQTVKEGEPNHDFGKDKNGNNYFNVNGDIYKDNKNIFNLIYPVGSIYMSANSTNPKTLFGGTWERLKGGFLYGAVESAGNANGTGTKTGASSGSTGSPSNNTSGSTTLTTDQIPSHGHSGIFYSGNDKSLTLNGGSNGYKLGWSANAGSGVYTELYTGYTGGSKGHTHTLSSHTHSLNSHTHNIPYMAVFVWKRTA